MYFNPSTHPRVCEKHFVESDFVLSRSFAALLGYQKTKSIKKIIDLKIIGEDGNCNEWVTFACDGTGPADESKRTKRVQEWSRLNWLGGILIIVSLF